MHLKSPSKMNTTCADDLTLVDVDDDSKDIQDNFNLDDNLDQTLMDCESYAELDTLASVPLD